VVHPASLAEGRIAIVTRREAVIAKDIGSAAVAFGAKRKIEWQACP